MVAQIADVDALRQVLLDAHRMHAMLSAAGAEIPRGRSVTARLLKAHGPLLLAALNAAQEAEAAGRALQAARHAAETDFLTGLPNRTLLRDRLSHGMALARREGGRLAVLFIDLDHFKTINDSMGHAAGDAVLKHAARVLEAVVRETDTVSRHGGDEFLVLLPQPGTNDDIAALVRQLIAALEAPLRIDDRWLVLKASIGISVFPDDGEDGDRLLALADAAMYGIKSRTGGTYAFHKASDTGPVPTAGRATAARTLHLPAHIERVEPTRVDAVASARAALERQGAFVSVVARELRQPLLAIGAAVAALQRRGLADAASARASVVVGQQLLQLVRLAADLGQAGLARQGFDMKHRSFDVAELMADAVEAHRPLVESRSQRIELKQVGTPCPLDGDAGRLMQMVTHLLDNASRCTDIGGCIEVTLRCQAERIEISVADTGCGLDAEALSAVSRHMAGELTAVPVSPRLPGLGLVVAGTVARAHGGDVKARSAGPSLGCEFVVTLPRLQPLADVAPG